MKYFLLIFIFVGFCNLVQSQNISVKEYQEEMLITFSVLSDVHANPFAFQTKEGLNRLKDSIMNEYESKDSISILTAFQCYAEMLSSIKCAHTGAYRTVDLDASINKFPVEIKVIDEKGLISQNYPDLNLYVGDQIVSINNISWKSIFEKGKKLHSSDGDSPLNSALFEKRSNIDIPIILGNPIEYKVVASRDSVLVESSINSVKTMLSPPISQGFEFCMVGADRDIGLVKIYTFPGDEKSIADFEKFCSKTRNKLERKKVKNFIIDVRDNGGGDRIDLLLRNFTPISFDLMSSIFDTAYLAKYSKDLVFHGINFENIQKIPARSQSSRKVDFQGDLYLDLDLYVLVNGRTASAASHFASLVKEHNLGKIVGTETGGRASGCNGNVYCSYFLPYSGIELYLPLMVNTYAVIQISNSNHGVIPDIVIQEELSDDMELAKLIQLIEEQDMD